MIVMNKKGTKQILDFNMEYWFRKWKSNAKSIFKWLDKNPPTQRLGDNDLTWWSDWKKITEKQYLKYYKKFMKEHKEEN